MNPFLITLTFLSLMAMITTTSVKHFTSTFFERSLYTNCLKTSAHVDKECVKAALNEVKLAAQGCLNQDKKEKKKAHAQKPPRRCPPLKIDFDRPPDNSRLNFYLLLFEEEPMTLPKCTRYEIAARLMRNLYQDFPFFQQVPEAEYQILNKLKEKKDEMGHFSFPDELGTIALEDERLQEVFYKMLKGGEEKEPYPSLLHFITFDRTYRENTRSPDGKLPPNRKKINLFFASPELLSAIFHEKASLNRFLKGRQELIDRIQILEKKRKETCGEALEEGMNRTSIKDKLAGLFKECFPEHEIYHPLFDFSLSSIGHVLLIKDPITQAIRREKIPKI